MTIPDDPDETPPAGLRAEGVARFMDAQVAPVDEAEVTGVACPACKDSSGAIGDGFLRTDNGHEIGMLRCNVCDGKAVLPRDDPKLVAFLKAYVEG